MGLLLTTRFFLKRFTYNAHVAKCLCLLLIALWCMKLATIRKHFEQYLHKWLSYTIHALSFIRILGLGIWDAKEIKPPFVSAFHFYFHSSAEYNLAIRLPCGLWTGIGNKSVDKLLCASFSQQSHNAIQSLKSQIYFIHFFGKQVLAAGWVKCNIS